MFFSIVPCHADVDDRASNVHCACACVGQLRIQDGLKTSRYTYIMFKAQRGKPLIWSKGCSLYRAATLRNKFQRPIETMKKNTASLILRGVPGSMMNLFWAGGKGRVVDVECLR